MTEPDREAKAAARRHDGVEFVNGGTRMLAILGHPIEQVRSPEMVTAELQGRGHNALLVPLHVEPADFDATMRQLKRVRNLDGLIFTIPFKQAACAHADRIGAQGQAIGAINALGRAPDGAWVGDMFDGQGCVEAFRRRGYALAGRRVMLIGAGGAGSAIGVAVAHEKPASMRLFDPDAARLEALTAMIRAIDPGIAVETGPSMLEGIDILLNASPVGMLGDTRMPIPDVPLAPDVIVFDAIVKPERTRLLAHAAACGCRIVRGREMMLGQIGRIADFFGFPEPDAANTTG